MPFPLGDEPAHMDQYITLSCTISDGDLPLNMYWTFNNHPITPESDVFISKIGKRSSVLTIENVKGHHAGNYSCHAQNSAGSAIYATELKVIGGSAERELSRTFSLVLIFSVFFSFFLYFLC